MLLYSVQAPPGELASWQRMTEITENGKVTTLAAEKIEVTLGTNWSDGGTLTITLGNVTVDTPSSLAFIKGPNTQPYASYQFTTRSSGKGGILTRLKPTTDEDGNPVDPQPRVRVSNIIAGSGAVTIEPTVSYEGEEVTFAISLLRRPVRCTILMMGTVATDNHR